MASGRGYLQIGNDTMEVLQVSYAGEAQPDDRERAVLWPQQGDGVGPTGRRTSGDVPKLYDAVVSLASELRQGQMAPEPWPAFLPQQISLQSPIVDAQRNRTWTLTRQVSDWAQRRCGAPLARCGFGQQRHALRGGAGGQPNGCPAVPFH